LLHSEECFVKGKQRRLKNGTMVTKSSPSPSTDAGVIVIVIVMDTSTWESHWADSLAERFHSIRRKQGIVKQGIVLGNLSLQH
jgi:hypothetical protein